MELQLGLIHTKWNDIRKAEAAIRYQASLAAIQSSSSMPTGEADARSRAEKWIHGSGGMIERWERKILQDGLAHARVEETTNEAAQDELLGFIADLQKEGRLERAQDPDWL